MPELKPKVDIKRVDTKEFELPETVFVRDIENRVFQGIVLECLAQIEGISLVGGNLLDSLLGRRSDANIKGIIAEQDHKNHSVGIRVEVNIYYGRTIPEKAEEIQTKISDDITRLTGLHVSSVHVVFKNVISEEEARRISNESLQRKENAYKTESNIEEEYSDEF
jgi:uncharacterized alkaline shock family protein YloU